MPLEVISERDGEPSHALLCVAQKLQYMLRSRVVRRQSLVPQFYNPRATALLARHVAVLRAPRSEAEVGGRVRPPVSLPQIVLARCVKAHTFSFFFFPFVSYARLSFVGSVLPILRC